MPTGEDVSRPSATDDRPASSPGGTGGHGPTPSGAYPPVPEPPKGFWDEHKRKIVGAVVLAGSLGIYGTARDFLGWAIQEKFTQTIRVVYADEIKALKSQLDTLQKENENLRESVDRVEEKLDLQNGFLQQILNGQ